MPVFRKLAPILPLVALLGLLASLLEGVGIGLLIPLLGLLLSNAMPAGIPAPIRSLASLFDGYDIQSRAIMLGAVIFGLILLKGLVQAANESFSANVEGQIGRDVRKGLAHTLLRVDYPFFLKQDRARLSHIVATDSWFVLDAAQAALTLIPAVAGLLVFAVLLAWLNAFLFLIVLVGGVAVQVALYGFERRQRRLSDEFSTRNQRLWERLLTLVQAPRAIRLFGQQQREEQRTLSAIEALRRNVIATRLVKAVMHPALDAMVALLFLVVLLAGYWRGMSIPEVTAFLLILTRMQPHARAISAARLGIASRSGSIREVEWLLSQDGGARARETQRAAIRLNETIRLDGISYAYPDGHLALDDVSVAIRPGAATALIGGSGSGKTTLVNVLCRLLEPQAGGILVGDQPASTIDPESWRTHIAVAGQDVELVGGSVFDNIAYGVPDATAAQVEEAARAAGAHAFIERLPDSYKTRLGPNGLSLSGGQRQRISLARALAIRPDLLILDEATNAVDALAESEIMKLLAEHRHFHTAIVISHRKTTLGLCEFGIVLENGRTIEEGRLSDLAYFQHMAGDPPEPAESA